MSAPKFDKTKPYGTVHGDESGCKYSQNGFLYGADEQPRTLVEATGEPTASKSDVDAAYEKGKAEAQASVKEMVDAAVKAAVAEHAKGTDKIVAAAIGAALGAAKKDAAK